MFKIRPTIFTIVTAMIFIAVSIVLTLQYFSSQKLALNATKKSIEQISKHLTQKLINIDAKGDDFLSLMELNKSFKELPKTQINQTMLMYFTELMKNKPLIYAIYIGFKNDAFYEIINLKSSKNVHKKFASNKDERWLIKKILYTNTKRVAIDEFLDKNFKILNSKTYQTKYYPTKRIWYKRAITTNKTIKTDPYFFSNLKSLGYTYAKQIQNSNNVIAIDISLKNLSIFLRKQKVLDGTQLYLLDKDKNLLATNLHKTAQPKNMTNILNNAIKNNIETLKINDIDYFVSIHQINSKYETDTTLISFVPKEKIMAPYNEEIIQSIIVSFLLILLFIPVIMKITSLMVQPIKDLEQENEKIKKREFSKVSSVKTQIKELKELSNSFVSMAHSIKEHEEAQVNLMDSFIKLIAGAIDAKSEYTGGHCRKVPIIALMLANAASKSNEKAFEKFNLSSDEEKRELNIAAWLHDCGKVTTPEYVVDKATKLETIYNRIHEIRTRFEVIYRDLKIESYKKLQNGKNEKEVILWLKKEQKALQDDFEFIANANVGGEFMSEKDKQRVIKIASRKWYRKFDNSLGLSQEEKLRFVKNDSNIELLLADKKNHIIKRSNSSKNLYEGLNFKIDTPEHLYNLGEIYNLCIEKGTLTNEERFKIQEHVMMSIKMLEELPFPEYLKRVPQYAGAHHETLIGTGYPKKLKEDEIPLAAKIIAIADVFEALTSSDRPYKKGKKLSDAIKILSFMAKDKHIDIDVFRLMLKSGIYMDFAKQYLNPEQIDSIDIKQYL